MLSMHVNLPRCDLDKGAPDQFGSFLTLIDFHPSIVSLPRAFSQRIRPIGRNASVHLHQHLPPLFLARAPADV
jgi:hypothetical protein